MRAIESVLARLALSPFRQKFKLSTEDREALSRIGEAGLVQHARRFVHGRLAPALPHNDGRQTPMRGHPVFVAQHATATCCRGCLEKWHGIAKGRALSAGEVDHVVAAITRWIDGQRSDPTLPSPSARRANDKQMRLPLE